MTTTTHQPLLGERFNRAFALASDLHRTDVRKGSDVPYISHLMSVAALVLEDGGGECEAIAALLHDALEDHGDRITAAELEAEFGPRVRMLVEACTDTPAGFSGGEKSPWKERKDTYIAHMVSGAVPTRVSLADKLHNARSILRDHRLEEEAVWGRFSAEKSDTLWYYRALAEAYRQAGADGFMIEEFERVLGKLEKRAADADVSAAGA